MNVLITSASRKVSLVRAFQSALKRRHGGLVIAVDITPYAPALYVADKHFLVPPSLEAGFMESLLRLCEQENVKLVVPTRDEELPLFAGARLSFEQAGVRILVPTAEAVRNCQDKQAFLSFCQQHGFRVPRTFNAQNWRQGKFPLFVRPRFGKGGKDARRILKETELEPIFEAPDQWILQECITAPEYAVDLLADFQGRVISAVPRLRQLVLAGESYVSRTVNEPALISESTRLANELGLIGPNTIQCFWDGKNVKFIEVNPRFGGASALGIAAGADTPFLLLELLEGEVVQPRLGKLQSDLVMLRFTEDLFLKSSSLASPSPAIWGSGPAKLTASLPEDNPFQAVLFDLDNTLYPEEEFVRSGFRAVSQCLAKHLAAEAEPFYERMLEILQAHGRGQVFDILLGGLKLDSRVWLNALILTYRSHRPKIALFPETADVLETLKIRGVHIGLVTDGMASMQRRKIAALGLEEKMEILVCTDELGLACAKPSTVPFEVALSLLGVPPQRAVYVGDDISKDFAGPNRLGMTTVRVPSSGLIGLPRKVKTEKSFEPHAEATSLKGLFRILSTTANNKT